jgi:2',3'-cyclic-nucleotide 2'-phosphodiesterase (5'-nucleotidase family)
MSRTKSLEILFVTTAGLGLLFVGWAVLISNTPPQTPTAVTNAAALATTAPPPTSTPTVPPTPTFRAQTTTLTILHTNDTWGYVRPCG